MSYAVQEIYFTLQGEGVHTGRPAVFLRFSGCNLWDGMEAHRESAVCSFCDTDFVGMSGPAGGKYDTTSALAECVQKIWSEVSDVYADGADEPFVVCTGGEPLLQLDEPLIDEFHSHGFFVAVETNGTVPLPRGLDWVCVSPKADAELVVREGDELKFVYPQANADPEAYASLRFRHFSLQPMDGPLLRVNTELAVDFCRRNPRWRLSLQTHKLLGIR